MQQFDKSITELEIRLADTEEANKTASMKIEQAKKLLGDIKTLTRDIDTLTSKLRDLTNEFNSVKIETDDLVKEQETLVNLRLELSEKYVAYNAILEESKYLDFMTLCLKDSGIKSTIINEYIPTINSIVNQNIKQLGLFATVKLDDQFNEEIKIRGFEAMSYNQLSEGEKLRLDMAIMMAWRDVAKLKSNMSCNLLIMDEIFDSSVDAEGTTAFADLLKSVSNLNVFVITHTPEKLADSFRSFIRLEKVNGFTTLSQSGNY